MKQASEKPLTPIRLVMWLHSLVPDTGLPGTRNNQLTGTSLDALFIHHG